MFGKFRWEKTCWNFSGATPFYISMPLLLTQILEPFALRCVIANNLSMQNVRLLSYVPWNSVRGKARIRDTFPCTLQDGWGKRKIEKRMVTPQARRLLSKPGANVSMDLFFFRCFTPLRLLFTSTACVCLRCVCMLQVCAVQLLLKRKFHLSER